jgi:hypothetical protein
MLRRAKTIFSRMAAPEVVKDIVRSIAPMFPKQLLTPPSLAIGRWAQGIVACQNAPAARWITLHSNL